jgi:hypothetical protein
MEVLHCITHSVVLAVAVGIHYRLVNLIFLPIQIDRFTLNVVTTEIPKSIHQKSTSIMLCLRAQPSHLTSRPHLQKPHTAGA